MLPFKVKMTTAFVLLILFYSTAAFWRLPCPRQIGIARVDPLFAPGAISQHAHTIHGGNSKYTPILSTAFHSQMLATFFCAALTFTSLRLWYQRYN
jgi:hypothetical protein